jgi:hypothetical protein
MFPPIDLAAPFVCARANKAPIMSMTQAKTRHRGSDDAGWKIAIPPQSIRCSASPIQDEARSIHVASRRERFELADMAPKQARNS